MVGIGGCLVGFGGGWLGLGGAWLSEVFPGGPLSS